MNIEDALKISDDYLVFGHLETIGAMQTLAAEVRRLRVKINEAPYIIGDFGVRYRMDADSFFIQRERGCGEGMEVSARKFAAAIETIFREGF